MIETGRAKSFAATLDSLRSTFPGGAVTIVETGSVRSLEGDSRLGDGWSTYHWLGFCQETGSTLYSVDVDPAATRCAQLLRATDSPNPGLQVHLVTADSVAFLRAFGGQIDLLYLDSYDYCGDPDNVARCHAHNLAEAEAALPKLSPGALVLIDDVFDRDWSGKGRRTIPFLLGRGFRALHHIEAQVLLQRRAVI